MTQSLTTLPNIQLPAHLQNLQRNSALGSVTQAVMAQQSGTSFHRISIKQSRWRLNDVQGNEEVVPSLHLDVIIVGANMHRSKTFYQSQYDPAAKEFKAPDCWSDNGIAPSVNAQSPQSVTCAACPHNAKGSKITPNGKMTKACADSKKLGVILADNPTGPVYQLRVPADSLSNLQETVKAFTQRNMLVETVVVRLTFDSAASHPKIIFTFLGFVNVEQWDAVQEVIGTDEVKEVIGEDDKPRDPATPVQAAQPAAPVHAAPAMPPLPQTAPPAAVVQPPAPAQPAPAAGTRKRRTKAELEAAKAAEPAPATAPSVLTGMPTSTPPTQAADFFTRASAAQLDMPLPHASAAAQVNTNPPATTNMLDDLIKKAMG